MKYQIIYADPAWAYNSRISHENRKTKFGSGASGHYDTMSIDEIKALPVRSIAADSALLFMWCTFPQLDQQIEVFKAWGFQYKTVAFTWVKLNTKDRQPFFGVGFYTKSNAEVCLLGACGKTLKPATDTVSSVILSPRYAHSRKPDEVRRRIELMYPTKSKVELFARPLTAFWPKAEGWHVWGNQIESDIVLA